MKRFVNYFLIVFLMSTNFLFGQKYNSIPFNIEWEGLKKNNINGTDYISFISFKGCIIDDISKSIPNFVYIFETDKNTSVENILLSNCIYIDLNTEENNLIINKNSIIENEIKVNSIQTNENLNNKVKIYFTPFRRNTYNNRIEKLVSFNLNYNTNVNSKAIIQKRFFNQHSVLSSGKWYKISVKNTGIHKISYADLSSFGINMSEVNPNNISLYGNGAGMLPEQNSEFRHDDLQEIAIDMQNGNDNTFDQNDYFLFYGQSQTNWKLNNSTQLFEHNVNLYSDYTYYYIYRFNFKFS